MGRSQEETIAKFEAAFDAVYLDLCSAAMALRAYEILSQIIDEKSSERAHNNVVSYFLGICFESHVLSLCKLIEKPSDVISIPYLFTLIRPYICIAGSNCHGLADDETKVLPQKKNFPWRLQQMRHKLVAHHAFPFDASQFLSENAISLPELSDFLKTLNTVVNKYSRLILGRATDFSALPEILEADIISVLPRAGDKLDATQHNNTKKESPMK